MSKKFLQRPADTLYNFQLYNFLPIKFISLQSLVLKRKDNRTPCISPLISPLLVHVPHLLYSSINHTLVLLFLLSFNNSVHKLLNNMNKT